MKIKRCIVLFYQYPNFINLFIYKMHPYKICPQIHESESVNLYIYLSVFRETYLLERLQIHLSCQTLFMIVHFIYLYK